MYNSAAFPIWNDAAQPSRSPSPGPDSSKHLPVQNSLSHTTALQKKSTAIARVTDGSIQKQLLMQASSNTLTSVDDGLLSTAACRMQTLQQLYAPHP